MDVTVRIPEPKASLESATVKQFTQLQKSLLRMVEAQESSKKDLHHMMSARSDALVDAMDRMMDMMQALLKKQATPQTLPTMTKLEAAMASLVKQMGRMHSAPPARQPATLARPTSTVVSPKVTVTMPQGLSDRLDRLQTVLLQGLRKSRSRTFGSNY